MSRAPAPRRLDLSGAWCVWLAARNNVWNWPIGVLNCAFFVVLFSG